MSKSKWTPSNIPDQKGKTIIITGASSGLGKEATKVLAGKNATVIMAVRNIEKAKLVAKEIMDMSPTAKIEIKSLDLNSLASIKSFSEEIIANFDQLDVLINNAGIMMCPYSKTQDGFEIQMGTNHFGHFALTGHLMPLLTKTKNSRIVVTSSLAHRQGDIDFSDFNWEVRKYKTGKAYGDSKLANLYFAYELANKLKEIPNTPLVTISHPGWTKTELDRHSGLAKFIGNIVAQTVQMGTLPTLRAATDINAKSGDYFGPSRLMEMRGYPHLVKSNKLSKNMVNAKKLWSLSQEMTGVDY
jgi:NAD(P)-dependent dehydrogenase (short-subunit alcohol dehydrogenase family)